MKTHIYEIWEVKATLRQMRTKAALKQTEVARKLNVDQSAVSNWERGRARPLRKYRKRLAKLYGVTDEAIEEAISSPQGACEDLDYDAD